MIEKMIAGYEQRLKDAETLKEHAKGIIRQGRKTGDSCHKQRSELAGLNAQLSCYAQVIGDLKDIADYDEVKISKEDHTALMEFSKELQSQPNDGNRPPCFWAPRSTKTVIGTEDDDYVLHSSGTNANFSPEEYADENEEAYSKFLMYQEDPPDMPYAEIDEHEWVLWVRENCNIHICYSKDEQVSEPNFSLFKSDVKGFIEGSGKYLGADPHTCARTFFHMDKMERLVEILYRLNPQPEGKMA